jgi:LacI family transcriptional regulator
MINQGQQMAGRKRRVGSGVTIRTVAAHAGVSAMTVSNVVNGRGNVGEATRQRVASAIKHLGYLPNSAARGLASPGSSRLGIIYTRPASAFVSAALVGAVIATTASGVQLLACDCADGGRADLEEAMQSLVDRGARGLLLLPPFAEMVSGHPILAALGVPVGTISTGRSLPDISTVRIDDRAAAEDLTRLLLRQGHRRIGFIGGPGSHSGSTSRREGFDRVLRLAGIEAVPSLYVEGDYTFEEGLRAADKILTMPDPPTAIFAANDETAAAAAWTAHRLGIRVPEDLAIVGFDDTPLAERTFPPLTAIHQPIGEMAQRASELVIMAMMQPVKVTGTQDVIVDYALVERQSTTPERST